MPSSRLRSGWASKSIALMLILALSSVIFLAGSLGQKAQAAVPRIGLHNLPSPGNSNIYGIRQLIYPSLGNPIIKKRGEQFTIEWDPRAGDAAVPFPTVTGFTVSATSTNDAYPVTRSLPVASFVKACSQEWPNLANWYVYRVTVTVPQSVPEDLYDLTVSAATGGAWVTDSEPHAFKAIDQYKDRFSFCQLSDIHVFGPEVSYPGSNQKERIARHESYNDSDGYGAMYFHKAIKQLNRMKPDFCIFTGDYDFGQLYFKQDQGAPWGETTEYEFEQLWFYQETLKLDVPVFMVMGNHDAYKESTTTSPPAYTNDDWFDYWRQLYGPLYHSFDYGNNHFLALNSVDWPSIDRTLQNVFNFIMYPLHYLGQLRGSGDDYADGWSETRFQYERDWQTHYTGQLQWMRSDLMAHQGSKIRVCAMHHDPWKNGDPSTSGGMWKDIPVLGMGNGQGRIACMMLMRDYKVALEISGHDHSDSVGSIGWYPSGGTVNFVNTTSTDFNSDGNSSVYPGYRRIWINNGAVESWGYSTFPNLSAPFYANTNVGGSTNLGGLSIPAVESTWNATPGSTDNLTNTLTNHLVMTVPGAYMEFPMPYLDGHKYYKVTVDGVPGGTLGEVYDSDTSPANRVYQVSTDLSAAPVWNNPAAPKPVRVYTDPTFVDTTPPTGSVSINGGAASTTSLNVTLGISATDTPSGIKDVAVSNSPDFAGAEWGVLKAASSYTATRAWTLAPGENGPRTVYVKFRDLAMPSNETVAQATIAYGLPPTLSSIDPKTGSVGTEVNLTGNNFQSERGNSYVTFNKTKATSFKSWGNTSIKVKVPEGATTGPVKVTTSAGTSGGINFEVVVNEWENPTQPIPNSTLSSVFYFAEGSCRPNFDPYICILNPGSEEVGVKITYMKGDGTRAEQQPFMVPQNSRYTVTVKDILGEKDDKAHDFSAKIETADKQKILCERPIYFNYDGKWSGGHDVLGATSPDKTFYFAEGTSRPNFDPYLCIMNPGNAEAQVKITYMKGDGKNTVQNLKVGKGSRETVAVKKVLGEGNTDAYDFSAKVECTNGQKILCERPMYFNYQGSTALNWNGGHDVVGTLYPQKTFYFAEGSCRPSFDPYICIQNPGGTVAKVKITYMKGDGKTQTQNIDVGKYSRETIPVKTVLGQGDTKSFDFSAKVATTNNTRIICERPMYFNYQGYSLLFWTGGHDVVGAVASAKTFYFAEGTCRPGFDTYVCVQNPEGKEAKVKITYTKGDGKTLDQNLSIKKYSRETVYVKNVLGEADDKAHDFSIKVACTNGVGIICERPMYFKYANKWTGGHDVVGCGYEP